MSQVYNNGIYLKYRFCLEMNQEKGEPQTQSIKPQDMTYIWNINIWCILQSQNGRSLITCGKNIFQRHSHRKSWVLISEVLSTATASRPISLLKQKKFTTTLLLQCYLRLSNILEKGYCPLYNNYQWNRSYKMKCHTLQIHREPICSQDWHLVAIPEANGIPCDISFTKARLCLTKD